MKRNLVTAPATTPISTAEVKTNLRITDAAHDADIGRMIEAAVGLAEDYTGKQLISQVWDVFFDCFDDELRIPMAPLITLDSVKYFDGDDAEQTLAVASYYVDVYSFPLKITPVSTWPTTKAKPNAVTIRLTAGYADADSVPEGIKQALHMLVGHFFEHPEAVSETSMAEVPMGARFLLDQASIRDYGHGS